MADIYTDGRMDRQRIQDRKLEQLHQEIAEVEARMAENAALRRQLEGRKSVEIEERTQSVIVSSDSTCVISNRGTWGGM